MNDINAEIKGVWYIVECPFCKAPQTKNRVIYQNSTVVKPFSMECDNCLKVFVVDLKVAIPEP